MIFGTLQGETEGNYFYLFFYGFWSARDTHNAARAGERARGSLDQADEALRPLELTTLEQLGITVGPVQSRIDIAYFDNA